MRETGSSAVTDEYNEDTDKTNDSEDDQWEDSKLVIDLDPSSSMNSGDSGSGSQCKDVVKSTDDSFISPEPKSEKPKAKRGVQRKNDKSDAKETASGSKTSGKQSKAEKDKPPPNKPGRKRKERARSKSSNGDVKSPASLGDSSSPVDLYKFETEEGISATSVGNHANKSDTGIVAMKDAQTEYDWRSVGSVTEPEQLAPCEPGTQVSLEGIVWQETNNGVLIVNVTWRGKTYMGTLLDATKHDWSPPSCDSPTTELETRTPKGRSKRNRVPLSNTYRDFNERKLRREIRKQTGAASNAPSPTPAKAETGRRKGRSSECVDVSEPVPKRGRTSRVTSGTTPVSSPALIECPEPNCGKKYKQMNGLKYHQRNAHQDTASHVSDSLSETDKPESISSPDDNKRTKRKNKVDNNKPTTETQEPKPIVKSEPEESESKSAANTTVTQTNTTSVITSTTTQISNSSQQSSVPVATITPQVVKPTNNGTVAEEPAKSTNNPQQTPSSSVLTASTNRSLTSAPKLLPKSSGNSMAPISTITSQGVYNPSLKPIQPKPTVLGESTPTPTLTDLRDHKKLKRKRSISRDDLTNGTSSPYPEQIKPNTQTHKQEPERKSSPSQRSNAGLQCMSYSDVTEDATQKEMQLNNNKFVISDPMCPPATYPVATVNPQKNIPTGRERDRTRAPGHSNHSPSPVPKTVPEGKVRRDMEQIKHHELDFKHREMEILRQYGHYQQQQMSGWMPPELVQQMVMARERQRQSISPRPSTIKTPTSTQSKELDMRMSNDRLQFLKENVELKHSHSLSNDMPHDLSLSSSQKANEELNRMLMMQQKREQSQSQSAASKSVSNPAKPTEHKTELSKPPQTSPMAPPSSFSSPYMSNRLLAYPELSGAMFPGRGLDLLHHAAGLGLPLPGMPEVKDAGRNLTPTHYSKPDHKIYELESRKASKSPRLNPHLPMDKSKAIPNMPPNFNHLFNPFGPSGLPGSGMASLFPPK